MLLFYLVGSLSLLDLWLVLQGLSLECLYSCELLLHGSTGCTHAQFGQGSTPLVNVCSNSISLLGKLDTQLFVLVLFFQFCFQCSLLCRHSVKNLAPFLVYILYTATMQLLF